MDPYMNETEARLRQGRVKLDSLSVRMRLEKALDTFQSEIAWKRRP